ncbi:MAG: hypothetical protein KBT39_00535 [Bacteroidales bacterium]|nr:hypothetical protein [Bacteroidales bacterium]
MFKLCRCYSAEQAAHISDFLFDVQSGRVDIQPLCGTFTLNDIMRG